MNQVKDPLPLIPADAKVVMVLFNTPPFKSSILRKVPGFPVYVQVIVLIVPLVQFSPPLGATTVMGGGAMGGGDIVKLEMLVSVTVPSDMLVTVIRKSGPVV